MLKLLFLFIILVALVPHFNFIIFFFTNLKDIFYYSSHDLFYYFMRKKYNMYRGYGKIIMYVGSGSQVFGSGKTLSMIRDVIGIYNKYNCKLVYSDDLKKFVTQRIHIISNVELYGVPYIKFESVNQFIDIDKYKYPEQDIFLFCLDESGAIFNSREFRNNIAPEFLVRLLQSRKHKCVMFMTSQRFQFTDKILREICSSVVSCSKVWRFVTNKIYSPLDLEYALNPEMIQPLKKDYFMATDKLFQAYNSFQLVEKLRKEYNPDDYLTTKEILETYGTREGNLKDSLHVKKKYVEKSS